MKNHHYYLITLSASLSLLLFLTTVKTHAQQQAFSYNQYADNLITLNPAYSLLDKAASINVLGRRQFIGIEGAPTTLLFNGSLPIPSINASAGLAVVNDQFAVERLTEVNLFFAKAITLNEETKLGVSLNAGLKNYRANYQTLDPNDPTFGSDLRETQPNIGFGIMLFTPKYYIGISVPQLNMQSLGTASVQQTTYLQNHYYMAAAYIFGQEEDFAIKPAALASYTKDLPVNFNFSTTIYLKQLLGIGANYNTNKQLAAMLSINGKKFKVGYSYEFGTSTANLQGYNNATSELSLTYRFGNKISTKLL
jgi:type IX secretion system PorP/SprF family membrane protein